MWPWVIAVIPIAFLVAFAYADIKVSRLRHEREQKEMAAIQALYTPRVSQEVEIQHQATQRKEEVKRQIPLEFCIWLQNNIDEILAEETRIELIQQAHADAATEKSLGNGRERAHVIAEQVKAAANGGSENK